MEIYREKRIGESMEKTGERKRKDKEKRRRRNWGI
jgi:hypothetical protein